jgi:hypothetical protein
MGNVTVVLSIKYQAVTTVLTQHFRISHSNMRLLGNVALAVKTSTTNHEWRHERSDLGMLEEESIHTQTNA